MKLIDKDALVAEIDRRHKYNHARTEIDRSACKAGRTAEDKEILDFLNTLEVKEVDLEKEYDRYYEQERYIQTFKLAKHFFELGLKVNNPITSADRGAAEEIIINLKKIEGDYNVCLTKEIEWVRKQVGQPELKTRQGLNKKIK